MVFEVFWRLRRDFAAARPNVTKEDIEGSFNWHASDLYAREIQIPGLQK